jgi:hypothetical protein
MLFARFLAETNLLIEPDSNMDITLEDCRELASERGEDWLELASSFAERMLPEIFRINDPVLQVALPPETRSELENLLKALPRDVFVADDSLGWVYQYWQADRKDEVILSESKIGADELPAMTQLFTEDYMVDFLLDNTLGAWHAGKVLAANPKFSEDARTEEELRNIVALPRCPWKYLRFTHSEDGKWTCAAGIFDGWPKSAKELKCLDPCMGSGHFLVALFERMVALRMAEERLDEAAAVAAVIRLNLFGLELDPRCTQIAAFNLALAAWRRVGHCMLPPMHLACSGLAPNARKEDWLKLAGDNDRLQRGMDRLYSLFKDAPTLGSLINPRTGGDLVEADFHELQPLLEKALARESKDDVAHEMAVTAQGLAKAAEMLASQFTLVATNMPYLGLHKQAETLSDYCKRAYPNAKPDLATCFVERCLAFCARGGSVALVKPQNALFLKTYTAFRTSQLKTVTFQMIAKLGSKAFNTPMWDFGVSLDIATNRIPDIASLMAGIDVGAHSSPDAKAADLLTEKFYVGPQLDQLKNPDAAIVFFRVSDIDLLSKYADSFTGAHTLDIERFRLYFWELERVTSKWNLHASTPVAGLHFSGMEYVSFTRATGEAFARLAAAMKDEGFLGGWLSGNKAWGKLGVAVSWMGTLPTSLYLGQVYDNSVAAIIPKNPADLVPIYCFCSSPQYLQEVRKLNQKTQVANATLVKVPFDLAHWQAVGREKYPRGLPKPHSNDPTQWLFNGYPKVSDQPLHVAVARLLGYRWPRQTGSSFLDCQALESDGLQGHVDHDGLVPLSPVKGEQGASARLTALLTDAFGSEWSAAKLDTMLAQVGFAGKTLDDWLRDGFFDQHCAIFYQRPFVWHIWDGRRDGFNALVNYHRLAMPNGEGRRTLEKLLYTYLGDWIERQHADRKGGVEGADGRVAAAEKLHTELTNILTGEPPYDLFIRWKALADQPIGWQPDINDGVRMNIRPFIAAKPVAARARGSCILRITPKIKWDKDRGKEPQRPREDYPWFWGWGEQASDFAGAKAFDGIRWNDLHYTRSFKEAARARTKK